MTDQNTREAREWAEYITAVPKLYGTFAPQARAAARFILDNTQPVLPDPLFGAWATHPEYGEGIVTSQFPDEDGDVRFVVPDQVIVDGTIYRWVDPSDLTFQTPDMSKNEAEIDTSPEHDDSVDIRPEGVGRKADELLDTRAGISIANYAWMEGYAEGKKFAIRDERFLSPNPVPENPYSAPHLRMIAADKRAEKEGTSNE